MIFMFLTVCSPFLAEATNTISIKTPKDYIKLTKNCKTDTWSMGKTIVLENDIDLSDIDFEPIPIFRGVFNGKGHTISGVNISSKGSYQGLFRYIQKEGRVENLNAKGRITPSGTGEFAGGIAGELSGTIINCTFNGTVIANSYVGGICGYVTQSGIIKSSCAYGSVTGKSYTGGVCGQNNGVVEMCENHANVNNTNTNKEKTIQDIGNIDISETKTAKSVDTNTDTGGICGYSKGQINLCKNFGDIGYRSIGYNTGGICGRSTGYITECENNGKINGRKDIGGICGQAEPYVLLEYSDSILEDIKNTLNDIKDIINSETYNSDHDLYNSVNSLNSTLGGISDKIFLISDDITDYANDVTSQINDIMDRAHRGLSSSEPVFNDFSKGMKKIADGLEDFKKAGEEINKSIDDIYNSLNGSGNNISGSTSQALTYLENASINLSRALAQIQNCTESLEDNIDKLNSSISELKKALKEHQDIKNSLTEITDSIDEIINSIISAGNSINDIAQILQELKNQGYLENVTTKTIENIKALSKNLSEIKKSLSNVRNALIVLIYESDIHSINNAIEYLRKSFSSLARAFNAMRTTMESINASFDKETSDSIAKFMQDGFKDFKDGTSLISDASEELGLIINDISDGNSPQFPSVSNSFSDNLDDLKASIDNVKTEISSMNNIFKDKKNNLTDSINDMTDQISILADSMSEAYKESSDIKKEDYFEDISDYDISYGTKGKIENSNNKASVTGDINIGGIVGAMAIEYDFDPEDDAIRSGEKSLRFTYKTKCIIRYCTNEGETTSKKNYSGGIVGKMDLGSVLFCDNYGKIVSTDGSYTGGIAGKSDTIIRSSAVKCSISGNDYVGGIAGKASKIVNCQTLVHIEKNGEFTGAIAGEANVDDLLGNLCVNDELGSIDDINYTGIAQQTTIDKFVTFVDNNFNKDVYFTLTFVADDKEIANITCNYKESLDDKDIPAVPKKIGYYGKWSDYNFKEVTYDAVINAQYNRSMDILASDEKRENGKSIILVCGSFDDKSSVSAKKINYQNAVDSYEVKISGVYTDSYTVRYLPMSDKKVNIFIDSGNGLKKVSAKSYGKYLEFKTEASDFKLYEIKKNNTMIFISVTSIIIIILIMIVVILRKKKGKKIKKCRRTDELKSVRVTQK